MMNSLARIRGELVSVLEGAGLRGLAHLQGRFTPPVFFVIPGAPYVTRGDTFGHFTYRFRIVLVSQARTAEFSTKQLDQMIVDAGIAVHGSPFVLESVDEPAGLTLNGTEYLGTFMDVMTVDDLDDGRP